MTVASVHDSRVFDDLLDEENSGCSVWADSAYRSEAREEKRRSQGYKSWIHQKGNSRQTPNGKEQAVNHRRSKIRSRVEPVFYDQHSRQGGGTLVRTKSARCGRRYRSD